MARQRRSFSEEFKREAVKLVDQSGASKADIARDLGISGSLLARWYREEETGKSPAAKAPDAVLAEEYERMRRELAKVKMWWSSNFGHDDRFFCCHFPFVDGGRQIAQD